MSDEKKTKDEHVIDFIKKFAQYEYAMEPFKEGKRELRKDYKAKGFLSTSDMQQAIRAYRALQKGVDLNETQAMKEALAKELGVEE